MSLAAVVLNSAAKEAAIKSYNKEHGTAIVIRQVRNSYAPREHHDPGKAHLLGTKSLSPLRQFFRR
jgi:hypothetical protein